jgi:N-acetylglutamate synthase-like GNAT family acetyltransferase
MHESWEVSFMQQDGGKKGMSSITGKIVIIRHATDRDRVIVEQYLGQYSSDAHISGAEITVALENDRIIGFGILKKERGAGCVSLFEDSRRKGIGSPIAKHLVKYAGLERVYSTRKATYFAHPGFASGNMRAVSRVSKKVFQCRTTLMERLPLAAQT